MRLVVAAALVAALLVGCSEDGDDDLIVLAASSLTDAFTEIAAAFEDQHPDVDVVLTFDSSTTLATQVAEGNPAGVLATADEGSMQTAVDSGEVDGDPVLFAANTPVLAVPTGAAFDPGFGDLVLAACAPEVPCGIVGRELLQSLGIDEEIDTEEENVAAVVAKLEAGEVDAGLVYRTDDLASDQIESAGEDPSITTDYPIAVVDQSEAADEFVAFVLGREGQAILEDAGFLQP
jgi:molybdate transport system substrate-binding protein